MSNTNIEKNLDYTRVSRGFYGFSFIPYILYRKNSFKGYMSIYRRIRTKFFGRNKNSVIFGYKLRSWEINTQCVR